MVSNKATLAHMFLTLFDRLHAKADPLDHPKHMQSPSAYAAAMEEFKQSQLGSRVDDQ
jgi:hypothetical protein